MIPHFQYHEPHSVQEATQSLSAYQENARVLSGGTDLFIQMQRGRTQPEHIISLGQLSSLKHLQKTSTGLSIGAMITHRTLEKHALLQGPAMALVEGCAVIGGHQIRNVATIGGNVCNASPAADTVPPLLCFDAIVWLASKSDFRSVPLEEFFRGPGQTVRRPDEILTHIFIPSLPPDTTSAFLKAGRRRAMEISIVNVAVRISFDADARTCKGIRIALGAVAPTAIRAYDAETLLRGASIDDAIAREAGRRAAAACHPISDVRASAEYRRMLIQEMVVRAVLKCASRRGGAGGREY